MRSTLGTSIANVVIRNPISFHRHVALTYPRGEERTWSSPDESELRHYRHSGWSPNFPRTGAVGCVVEGRRLPTWRAAGDLVNHNWAPPRGFCVSVHSKGG